jgi:hypothetical protein
VAEVRKSMGTGTSAVGTHYQKTGEERDWGYFVLCVCVCVCATVIFTNYSRVMCLR